MVRQGEIYWLDGDQPFVSEPGFRRPWVVVQNDLANESRLRTTIVAAMTSNLRRAGAAGNVMVAAGRSGLRTDSVVLVTTLNTVDKDWLTERAGELPTPVLRSVLSGIHEVFRFRDAP